MSSKRAPRLQPRADTPLCGASDAGAVVRAKADPQAFAELYQVYVDPVYRYCAHRLGNHHAAEDATSEIFIKAMRGIHACRDDRAFRSWLFAIAHNVITDNYRARRPDGPIDGAGEVADGSPSPEEVALVAEGDRSVHALLGQLVPKQARILELRLAGLTGPEIAEVLGCSLASVKIGQVRGYARLREIVQSPENERDRYASR
jgi:RNA polymerase sigma-70 factor (ECF subfamily)